MTSYFPSGSIGLTAPGDCQTAVCLMADTKLELERISERVQQAYGLKASEEGVFVRREHGPYRDAIRFASGVELILPELGAGVQIRVIDALEGQLSLDARQKEPELV